MELSWSCRLPHGFSAQASRVPKLLQPDHFVQPRHLDRPHCRQVDPSFVSYEFQSFMTIYVYLKQQQPYLRQSRDAKLLSSLPPLAFENCRRAGRRPTVLPVLACGHRHIAAASRVHSMLEVCKTMHDPHQWGCEGFQPMLAHIMQSDPSGIDCLRNRISFWAISTCCGSFR